MVRRILMNIYLFTLIQSNNFVIQVQRSRNICYSMLYNDDHLTNDEGYAPGLCPKIYSDYLGSEEATYVKDTRVNVKYCQGPLITVNV